MKKIIYLLIAVVLLQQFVFAQGKITFSPEKPKAGEKITIKYNPTGSKLEKASGLSVFVHSYGKNIQITEEYDLKKEGNAWTGSFFASDSSSGVVLRFTDGKEFDNNNSKCFPIRFYGNDGKLTKYASSGLALGYMSWFGAFEVDPSYEIAYKLFGEELSANPSLKKELFTMYNSAFARVDKEKAAEFLKVETENYEKILTDSEEDLGFLLTLYKTAKAKEKIEKVQALLLEKYPTGSQAEMIKLNEVYGTKDEAKRAELTEKFKVQFPNSKYLAYLTPDPTQKLIKDGKYEDAYEAIKKNEKATSSVYNNLAWTMYEKDANLNLAKEIALKGIELGNRSLQTEASKRPPYYSEKQYKKMISASGYAIIDTYGAILLKLGENQEALKYMKQAFDLDEGKSADVNERYTQALVSNEKFSEATTLLEKFIADGNSTPAMKDLLKTTYIKSKGNDSGFEKYVAALEKSAFDKKTATLKKEMINDPAPKFSLLDLEGKTVSLEDFKGKVVIVDFWATWCGPCLASFPGMKKAVEKFEATGKAKFLFVNTWENVEDKKKNAVDFIEKNKYPFHVLLDDKNTVIESYKVSGIPTKFIIDGKGNIRFKSVGYSGDPDKLVEELDLMIQMAQ